jgi:L-threonylcarbamoyladenylate synthase
MSCDGLRVLVTAGMPAQILRMSEVSPAIVGGRLAAGEVGVVPTETVYGLGIIPGHAASLGRVYDLKGRPPQMNLPVLIGTSEHLDMLGVDFNPTAQQLAELFWPGPLTIVMGFDPHKRRPDWLAHRDEVAVRFPAFEFLIRVTSVTGPLLLTSANAHGDGAKSKAPEALQSLLGEPDFVVDAGTLANTPSTIINTRRNPAVVERLGSITLSDLDSFIRDNRLTTEA